MTGSKTYDDPCPLGGKHQIGVCVGEAAVACRKCHQSWFTRGGEWVSPFAAAKVGAP